MPAIYDISLPVSEDLVTWPGDPKVIIEQVSHLDKGDTATVSRLSMGVHSGTHVDAPAHFIRGGKNIDALDLNILIGQALVVDTESSESLSAATFEKLIIPQGTERVLFRTSNSDHWNQERHKFHEDYVAITEDGANWLAARNVRLVGIDYLSVAPFDKPVPTHDRLLAHGIILLEGLNLNGVNPGVYQLVCLPLKLTGAEAAPARAVLIG